ncbi:bifunctional 4-hydroxy-2-oxoglutarate aldolase/2-dehydro-3-deoxy-phosphogluconate aldolase [Deinococcus sp. A31D244]|uniref:bifunctional 4-hydroxy-2-oxoglutarate aldolase/2-dehydro-3-deoxy-phosphogluconate aldolase n=1 Tax=Deinococcus sp. A31D244 TaxID=3397675 RepID=UPI0039DF6397
MPADLTAGPTAEPLVDTLRAAGVVGVLRAPDARTAVSAALAAARGGLRVIELTFTTPGVTGALRELRAALSGVTLGVGTVLSTAQAREAAGAGAQFLVSPHLDGDLLRAAQALNVPYLPGILTPSEAVRAGQLGARVLKVFPAASAGGPGFIRDLRGPLPHLHLMATGGVRPHEVPAYRDAGALAVGLGGHLFPSRAVETGDWDAVEAATRAALREAGLPL